MIIIYHRKDLDGWTSGAILKRYAGMTEVKDLAMIGYDYGDPVPDLHEIQGEHDTIMMADISFPMDKMIDIAEKYQLVWIDHHISAINAWNKSGGPETNAITVFPPTILKDGQIDDIAKAGACELCWMFCFPYIPMPFAVYLLGDYDSFRHKGTGRETSTLYFQYAARAVCSSVEEADQFIDYDEETINKQISNGKYIFNYLKRDSGYVVSEIRKINIHLSGITRTFGIFNQARLNPSSFGFSHSDYNLCGWIAYHRSGDIWNFSVYSDDPGVDCSQIAKERGGGGHKGAAGFRVEDINAYLNLVY